ncbi:MAG: sensor histidine kinase [Bacteroidetes bacterium]|nr:sensor histidine kinase [Bacteroidota bacterium]
MKINLRHIYFAVLFLPLFFKAETDPKLFLEKFNKADLKNKVRLLASVPFSEIKDIYPQIKDTLEKVKSLVYMRSQSKEAKFLLDKIEADIELYNQNYTKAIFILENSLRNHASNIQDSLRCYSMLKNAFVKIRDINKAFEIHHLMENKWDRKSDTVIIDYGHQKSTLYNMIGLTDQAISERRAEGKKYVLKNDTDGYANLYNDIGFFFNAKKKSDSAQFYFLKAKELLLQKKVSKEKETFYNFFIALIDGNLALSYFNQGDAVRAIPLLKVDVYYSLKVQNYESAFNSYNLLTKCYVNLKQKQLAKNYLDSAQNLLNEKVKGIAPKLRLLLTCASYYNSVKDFYKSNECYQQYVSINDSFQLMEKERQVHNQGVAISIEKSEIELNEKDRVIEQNKFEEAKQRTFRAYLLAGIIILLTVIIFLILNNRNSKKREVQLSLKNKQIGSQNFLIEQSLKEKEALIKEIHHRVKNNLQIISSMLSLQMGKVDDENIESILKDAQQRINAISLTHQMLYQKDNISTISLGDYVENLVSQIEVTIFSSNIELSTSIASRNRKINIDTAVPLGLMINEILTNAYKHAFSESKKGHVSVSLADKESGCILKISDNGKGLPENFENLNQKSMGMELIHILAEQLDANLKIEKTNGTTFIIEMKF